MPNPPRGRLQPVDIRKAWESEAREFTPWLATEENLTLLGDALNIDLELEGTEQNVGPFRADILCKDTASDAWVLIENQLERTDHGHLGQLLTYAAGLNAVTVIWLAGRFTDEHRATLDWLNEITGDNFNFFGIEIQLWRIGDSDVAPKFNIVAKPNDWTKTIRSGGGRLATAELTDTNRKQREFWAQLMARLDESNSVIKPRKPQPVNWMSFSIGRSDFGLLVSMNTRDNVLWSGVTMKGPNSEAHFRLLQQDKKCIEQEFGQNLNWQDAADKKERHVGIYRTEVNPLDESDWPRQLEWLQNSLEKLFQVFHHRIQNLDANEYVHEWPSSFSS